MQPLHERRGFRTQCPSRFIGVPRAQEASAGCHPAFLGGSIAGLALVWCADQFYAVEPFDRNALLGFQRADAEAWLSPSASATAILSQSETGVVMKQMDLFQNLGGPETDAAVPLVRVKACQPLNKMLGGGWICLLECGHEAQVPVGPRPRHVPHVCPPDKPA